jgi:hypothetical protein
MAIWTALTTSMTGSGPRALMLSDGHAHLRHVEHLPSDTGSPACPASQPLITPAAANRELSLARVRLGHLRQTKLLPPVLLPGPEARPFAHRTLRRLGLPIGQRRRRGVLRVAASPPLQLRDLRRGSSISSCYMPNRARRTAWTAASGPLTSTCAAPCRPKR